LEVLRDIPLQRACKNVLKSQRSFTKRNCEPIGGTKTRLEPGKTCNRTQPTQYGKIGAAKVENSPGEEIPCHLREKRGDRSENSKPKKK